MPEAEIDTTRTAHSSAREVIVIGVITSLSMGSLDLVIHMLAAPAGLSSFSTIFSPLSAMTILFFLCYLILYYIVFGLPKRLFGFDSISLAMSTAEFLAVLVIFYDLIPVFISRRNLIKLSLLLLIAVLFSIGGYFTSRTLSQRPKYKTIFTTLGFAAPFILAETMIFIWLHMYLIDAFMSMQSLIVNVVFLLAISSTIVVSRWMNWELTNWKVLTVFMLIVMLLPIINLLNIGESRQSSMGNNIGSHSVRHIILIVIDTLRSDALSCYNPENALSHHIDHLVEDGILFRRAVSGAPWTLPSMASIMTGLSPLVHQVTGYDSRLPAAFTTLAEYMNDEGYKTAAIGRNTFLTQKYNISQGFSEYNFFPKSTLTNSLGTLLLHCLFPDKFLVDVTDRDITRLAEEWIGSNKERDFFLWLHYFDPHAPYEPLAEFLPEGDPPSAVGMSFSKISEIRGGYYFPSMEEQEWIRKLYDAEVATTDESIGNLLEFLERNDLYHESLIILTSDHGEEFWEHEGVEHGHSLHPEVLNVPLIVKLPSSVFTGEINEVVSTQSILPTVLDLCDIPCEDQYLTASSLAPLWQEDPVAFNDRPIVSGGLLYYEDRESVIFDGFKYIRYLETGREELYALTEDPEEQSSLVSLYPDKVQEAKRLLLEHDQKADAIRAYYRTALEEKAELDEEALRELRSLGYVQ